MSNSLTRYFQSKVAERRARCAQLQRDLELVFAELRAYEDALRRVSDGSEGASAAAPPTAPIEDQVSVFDGNPPHAAGEGILSGLSGHWAAVINHMVATKPKFTTDDVEAELKQRGYNIQRKSIRSKLATLVNVGKLVRLSEGVFAAGRQTLPVMGLAQLDTLSFADQFVPPITEGDKKE